LSTTTLAVSVAIALSPVMIAHRHRPPHDVEHVLPDVTPGDVALATAQR
jgi:hypothetical protein